MRRAALLLAFLWLPVASAQELDRGVLDKLKSATCFVVVQSFAGRGSGSGVLFLKRGTTGYLLTCEHVVRGAERVTIVFASGTSAERVLEGRVIGVDADRDLAAVVLKDARDLPAPLEVGTRTAVTETEAVYVAGFPFGRMLAADAKNPEISISKVSVSSVRRDNDNRVVVVQMSGDVNPGNSGGPVVDAKGKVVGITRSKVGGTSTAFAVPAEEIQSFLKGRVSSSSFKAGTSTESAAKFDAVIGLIDPMGTLKGVTVWWCPEKLFADSPPQPGKDGSWGKIHGSMKSSALKIDEDQAVGTIEVARPSGEASSVPFLCQISWVTPDGRTLWTGPAPLTVDYAEPAAPAAKGAPKPAGGPDPVPVKGADLAVGDEIKIVATQRLRAALPELLLSPDGATLYSLDLSEGKVWALKPDTLEVTGQVDTIDNAVCMSLTPDGRTIYVGARDSNQEKCGGHLQVISTGSMKTTSTFAVPFPIQQVVATNSGTVAATGIGQWGGFAILDPAKKTLVATVHLIYGGSSLRLHPDQLRAYTGDTGISPGDFHCVNLRKDPKGQYETYDSPYHGEHPLGGAFEISPDGRFLIGQLGSVLRLGRTREADLQLAAKIDPGVAIGIAKGSNTFVVANKEGFLKVYDLQTFELKKSVKVGKFCSRLALDPARGRLYAVAGPLPTATGYVDPRAVVAGDIVSFSLSGK